MEMMLNRAAYFKEQILKLSSFKIVRYLLYIFLIRFISNNFNIEFLIWITFSGFFG
jgi:hypothetical protein